MANPRRRSRTLRYFGAGGLARRASRNKCPSDAADKLLLQGNMKSAIRSPNLTDLAIWPASD